MIEALLTTLGALVAGFLAAWATSLMIVEIVSTEEEPTDEEEDTSKDRSVVLFSILLYTLAFLVVKIV